MKKSSFIALVLATLSGTMFALGMCMALLPEWNAFNAGVILGVLGLVMGIVTLFVWCRMEKKSMPPINKKTVLRILYGVFSVLVLGTGICMCLVWKSFVWGTVVGLLGIILLIALIPMFKGIK